MNKLTAFLATSLAAVTMAVASTGAAQESDTASGELRGPSPRMMDPNRPGYFQIGVGPAAGLGLDSDRAMYDITAGYNHNFNDRITGKIFGDFNLGSSTDTSRFINIAAGADYYLNEVRTGYGIPYIGADVGAGFTRNNDNDQTKDAAAVGIGTGFKFAAAALNMDVNLHYTVLTAQLNNTNPSVLALRLAVNF